MFPTFQPFFNSRSVATLRLEVQLLNVGVRVLAVLSLEGIELRFSCTLRLSLEARLRHLPTDSAPLPLYPTGSCSLVSLLPCKTMVVDNVAGAKN